MERRRLKRRSKDPGDGGEWEEWILVLLLGLVFVLAFVFAFGFGFLWLSSFLVDEPMLTLPPREFPRTPYEHEGMVFPFATAHSKQITTT